jgi:hypothetical protein
VATVTRDRAQLILVGGLVIAVGLVGIAIVLNSGIYTHNLASRVDPTASDAVGHTVVVRDSVGGLVEFAVRHHPDDFATQEANVTDGVSNVSDLHARGSARHGLLTNATVAAVHEGRTVNQTGDREFTNTSGDPDWEVAADAEGVRAFRMDVKRSGLNDQDGLLSGLISADTFNVTFDPASGTTWTVSIYRDSGTGTTNVTVTNTTSGRLYGPCTDSTGTRTEIDLTAATVAGEHCGPLERLGDVSRPFDVEFHDGHNAVGSYSLVVDTTNVDDSNVAAPGTPGPSELETLYSVELDLQFQSQRVDYRTTITVAPGEPDG